MPVCVYVCACLGDVCVRVFRFPGSLCAWWATPPLPGGDETGGPDDRECVSYGTWFVPRDVFVSDVKEKIIKVNYRARRGDHAVFTFETRKQKHFFFYVNKTMHVA